MFGITLLHVLKFLAIWAATGATLWLVGISLSALTLKAMTRGVAFELRRSEVVLQWVYAVVMWATCLFFFVSLPFFLALTPVVLLMSLPVTLGTLLFAPKLVWNVMMMPSRSVMSLLRGMFGHTQQSSTGVAIDIASEPGLVAVVYDVAQRLKTEPIDLIWLTAGAQLGVFEDVTFLQRLTGGKGTRNLVLGSAMLQTLSVEQFKSVLAHEYGHFRNADTRGGAFAIGVRATLYGMAEEMVGRKAASVLNPVWLFMVVFERIFVQISAGASRMREVMADRQAIRHYGAAAFEQGMTRAIWASVQYHLRFGRLISQVMSRRQPLYNLTEQLLEIHVHEYEINTSYHDILNREPSRKDSHPAPAERIRYAHQLDETATLRPPAAETPAWSMFADRASRERQLTEYMRMMITSSTGYAPPPGSEWGRRFRS